MRNLIIIILAIVITTIAKAQVYNPMKSLVQDTYAISETLSGADKDYILWRMAINILEQP